MKVRNAIRTLLSRQERQSCVDPGESVVFFSTAASKQGDFWELPIHGWTYQLADFSGLRRAGLRIIKRLLRTPLGTAEMALFRKRMSAFVTDNVRGKQVNIQLGGATYRLKRSRPSGHFITKLQVSASQIEQLPVLADAANPHSPIWLDFHALMRPNDRRSFGGRILLLPPKGLSVISDIDDTIKVTEVLHRRRMLRNTFLREFKSIPDMAAIYRSWETTRNAVFHYVSASPWHLYPFLADFLAAQGFPEGTFHLRDFRLMPRDLVKTLRLSRSVKHRHIRTLLTRFPERRFILIGDSGESDAALYASLFRAHPAQIEKIYIRNITSDPPNSPRWKRTFAGIPASHYQVFNMPREIIL